MNTALRIILATTSEYDAQVIDAAHAEALQMNARHDRKTAVFGELQSESACEQFFRCAATVAACLADGRAGIDALTDAADADVLTDAQIQQIATDVNGFQFNIHKRKVWEFGAITLSEFARAIIAAHQECAA